MSASPTGQPAPAPAGPGNDRDALISLLKPQGETFVDELYERSLRDIAGLDGVDVRVRELLRTSIEQNVGAILHVLEHDLDPAAIDAPAAAITYAKRLAQHEVPLSSLLRNYRIGHQDFIQLVLAAGMALPGGVDPRLVMVVVRQASTYIDAVSEQVVVAYEQERDRWIHRDGALLSQRVRTLLADGGITDEVELALGYRLAGTHVAVVLWADPVGDGAGADVGRADGLARQLARLATATGQPLLVPADEREVWAWIPVAPGTTLIAADVLPAVEEAGLRVAIGAPAAGVEGFRSSHAQAQRVKALAVRSRSDARRAMTFGEVGPIALMATDLPALRDWIGHVLGPLGADAEREGWLRDTVRVFLQCNGSWAGAAERLMLHRNTVQYRVNQAEELLGHSITDHRLELELALTAAHLLGTAAASEA